MKLYLLGMAVFIPAFWVEDMPYMLIGAMLILMACWFDREELE